MPKYVILLLCIFSSIAARGSTPSEASIRALLEVTNARSLVEGMMAQMDSIVKSAMEQASQGQEPSPEVKAVVERMQDKMMAVLKEELDWSILEPLYISVYGETFTQEEVDGMLAFYRTPVGQAVIKKLPVVVQKSMSSMQARMGPMIAKLQIIQEEAMRELHPSSGEY